ncbi:unnamed protein product [Echinostoma caproni]|uniref:YDG domain-containing protein n=1 Tax=Echinostoma caproni TaxID=27848 RepID=A0A183B079_9TREM|nr:unnamed protein product [Echinostoma caproni]
MEFKWKDTHTLQRDADGTPVGRFGPVTKTKYDSAVTYHFTTGELDKLERVQRAASTPVVGLRGTSYEGRLQATGLFPVAYRHRRGDLMCLRRIRKGDMGPELQQYFPLQTAPHAEALSHVAETLVSWSSVSLWTLRSTTLLNSLPAIVVEEKKDAAFKRRLDEHMKGLWENEHL